MSYGTPVFSVQPAMPATVSPGLTTQEQNIVSGVSGVFGALGWLLHSALLVGGVFAIHKGHKWVGSGLAYAGTTGLVHKVIDQTGTTTSTTTDLVISGGAFLSTIGLNAAFAPKSPSKHSTAGYRRRRR